jgi:hypothetical protein
MGHGTRQEGGSGAARDNATAGLKSTGARKEATSAQSAPAASVKEDGADKAKARLATFAKPTLGPPGKKRKKMKAHHPQQHAVAEAHLTKAQRKNLWRKRRREALKATRMSPS